MYQLVRSADRRDAGLACLAMMTGDTFDGARRRHGPGTPSWSSLLGALREAGYRMTQPCDPARALDGRSAFLGRTRRRVAGRTDHSWVVGRPGVPRVLDPLVGERMHIPGELVRVAMVVDLVVDCPLCHAERGPLRWSYDLPGHVHEACVGEAMRGARPVPIVAHICSAEWELEALVARARALAAEADGRAAP